MNIKRSIVITLIACTLAAVFPVSGYATDNAEDWTIYFRPGVRFGSDDRTLFIMDFLVPLYRDDENILFFNAKLTPDDLDGFEANLGIGYRRLLFSDRVILGGNVFYDTRRTGWGTDWDQIGVGAEAMAEFNKYVALTGRFNYYFPLTDPRVTVTGGGSTGTGYFFRTGGIWTYGGSGGEIVEEAPEGFDGEVGFRVPVVSDYVETWVYVGGYHYHGRHVGTIDGVSARLEIIPTDFVRLSYEYRNDRTTHGEHHGEVGLELPFSVEKLFAGKNPFEGLGSRLSGSRSLNDRMVEPVRRDVDIRVVHGDPGGTGGPGGDEMVEGVVFVSEDGNDTTGDGSFENPFRSIGRAADAIGSGGVYAGITTIHIINDSDTETAGGGTADLASLMIWGSGMPHPIYGIITNQMSGYPTVSGELILFGGTVDVLGTTYTGANGITVNGANANIHHNYFSGNDWGIVVNSGSAVVTDNLIGGGAGLSPMTRCGIYADGGSITSISRNTIDTVSDSGGYGIYFYNLPSVASTVISDNTISVDDTMGTLAAGILFSTCGPMSGISIASNTITVGADNTGYVYGIGSIYGTGDYGVEIAGNSITATGGAVGAWGIDLDAPGGSITADIHDNPLITVSSSGDAYGINLRAYYNIYARITGNDLSGGITGAGTSGVVYGISLVTDSHPSTETYDIAGIGGNGLLISNNNLGGTGIRATGTGGYACGINIYSRAGNLYALSSNGGGITGNTIVANASDLSGTDTGWADGIIAETRDDLAVTITGGSITSNGIGAWGIGLVSDLEDIDAEISVPTITATGTYTAGTGYDATGIFLRSPSGTIDATVTGTNITALGTTNTRARGINAIGYGGITALISGGSITSTGRRAEGIYLGTTGTGSIVDASISNLTLNITGTNTTGSGNDTYATGIFLSASTGGIINANLSGNDVAVSMTSGFTARGIYVTTPGDIAALISGGSINSTGGRAFGILLESTGTGGDVDADISVPAILVTANGNGLEALGIKLATSSGNIDADIHGLNGTVFPGVTGMKVTGTYGYARGISIESGGGITGGIYGNSSSNRNTITVEGMLGGSNYPTGVYLRAAVDVGLQGDPFEMYYNDLTVTNISPTMREAFGFAINYGSSTNHDVYARIYNNTITVTGGNGSFGYGAIGGYIRAANLIGYNGSTVSAPTIISGNTLNLTSNVPALGFYIYRTNAVNPGNGNYVDFSNGTYGGANTVTGSSGLYNNASFSMGHPGYWCNFYWGTSGTSGSGQDYIHF